MIYDLISKNKILTKIYLFFVHLVYNPDYLFDFKEVKRKPHEIETHGRSSRKTKNGSK